MLKEEDVRLQARLAAIEHLVCEFWAIFFATRPQPIEELDRFRTLMKSTLQRQTLPPLDAASSDLAASELEAAADDLQKLLRTHLENLLARKPGY